MTRVSVSGRRKELVKKSAVYSRPILGRKTESKPFSVNKFSMNKNYLEHKNKAVETDNNFSHVMAITLDPRTYYQGIIRCITRLKLLSVSTALFLCSR